MLPSDNGEWPAPVPDNAGNRRGAEATLVPFMLLKEFRCPTKTSLHGLLAVRRAAALQVRAAVCTTA